MFTLLKGHVGRRTIIASLAALVVMAGLLWFTSSGDVGTVSADEGTEQQLHWQRGHPGTRTTAEHHQLLPRLFLFVRRQSSFSPSKDGN